MSRFDTEVASGFLLGCLFMAILWGLLGCSHTPDVRIFSPSCDVAVSKGKK